MEEGGFCPGAGEAAPAGGARDRLPDHRPDAGDGAAGAGPGARLREGGHQQAGGVPTPTTASTSG